MKAGEFVLIILMVALVFTTVGLIVSDFETQYPDVDVNTSWSEDYDYSDQINESATDLKDKFETITNDETGWFAKAIAGITAVPTVIIFVPSVILESLVNGIKIVVGLGDDIGIPAVIITYAIIGLMIIIIFALIGWWHRSKI